MPLHNAAYYGSAPMVRLLLGHGCSVDVETVVRSMKGFHNPIGFECNLQLKV